MKQDEIIRMAREAGFKIDGDSWIHAGVVLVDGRKSIDKQLKNFANLAAAGKAAMFDELLEALKSIAEMYSYEDSNIELARKFYEARCIAGAAIAKAEGGQA